jgi:hypothetical protein
MMTRKTLTEIAIEMGVPEQDARREADAFYAPRRLGECFVAAGLMTKEKLELALVKQRAENRESSRQDVAQLRSLAEHSAIKKRLAVADLLAITEGIG